MQKILKKLRELAERYQFAELAIQSRLAWDAYAKPDFLVLLAYAQARLGEQNAAWITLEQIHNIEYVLDDEAMIDLCGVYILLSYIDKAILLLKTLLQRKPKHDLLLARLGYCCMHQGDMRSAYNYFKQSLKKNPRRMVVLMNLFDISYQCEELDQATIYLRQCFKCLAAEKKQISAELIKELEYDLLGWQIQLWIKKKQFSEAEVWLESRFEVGSMEDYSHWLCFYASELAKIDNNQHAEAVLRNATMVIQKNPDLMV